MAHQFHFGEFTLSPSSYRLQRGERLLRLEKMPMELLILLVQRQGELVSRDEIATRLWGKDVFVDVDHGINTAVRKLRLVLRDDSEKPRFVETVVGKGYRFAAPVICENGDASPQAPPLPQAADPLGQAAPNTAVSVWLPFVVGAVAILAVLALVFASKRAHLVKDTSPPAIRSLAVLPLKNFSADPAQDYFADGMTEAVIGRLAMIPGLRIISRTSAMRFKQTTMPVPEIARMLHVDGIVEGSVQRDHDRVRVTVQLIRGATDEHIWSDTYEREYRGILALQDDIARSIAQRVETSLAAPTAQAAARPVDPQAHEDYLKGRYYFNQRTEGALNKSIAYFQQAIARDPNYALAYSGLADDYALLGFRGGLPSKDALQRAKAAALKAIQLDDTLAEPHASLGFIAETHEWDWATAEREYKRALQLNPGNARAHHWYAGYLMYVGRFEEGIAEAKLARDLDPLSLPLNNALAGRLLVAGRLDEALKQLRETLEMDSHFAPAHQTLGWVYLQSGKHDEAIREFQQALELAGTDNLDFELDLGFAYATAGRQQEARRILAKFKTLHQRGLAPAVSIAILYGALGQTNQAFVWLDMAYRERDPALAYVKVPGRRFEPLRHDPRFQELVARMGFPG